LPLFYSQGFHPKPDMTFGPALSLGVSSLVEIVDVKICADLDPAELLAALSEGAQDGTVFTGGLRLGPNDASVPRIVDAARYVVAIPRSAIESEAWLDERVAAVREATTLPIVRRIDGIGKKIDVREYLRRIDRGDDDAKSAVARAGIVGDFLYLTVDVEIRGSGAVKIGEVVEVLASAELPHRAVRTALGRWLGDGVIASPMNLSAVAKAKTVDTTPAIVEAVAG
jgi:radical SAM-linked protein